MNDLQCQVNDQNENEESLIRRIKSRLSENHFRHTMGVVEAAVPLAKRYGLDEQLVRKTALLHDIAKDMSQEEMLAVTEQYGYTISEYSLKHTSNMHAELGALIAEREFGLSDKDALNAIRFHVSTRPDMSLLEKIICVADHLEPYRPNQHLARPLYELAKTNLDLALLRFLPHLIDYQLTRNIPDDVREISMEAYDFLLEEYTRKNTVIDSEETHNDTLSDEEFDEAVNLIHRNQIRLTSVENARWLRGFTAADGRTVKDGLLIRSGDLHNLTNEEADYLKSTLGLSLVIDLRTPTEVEKAPNKSIHGVLYKNIPLTYILDTKRMDYLTLRYIHRQSENEGAWYTEQYARTDGTLRMYMSMCTDVRSIEAIRQILHLLTNADGPVLFHCSSGKDRAGILAALVLAALGCSREDIISDYSASAISYFSRVESIKTNLRVQGKEAEELKLGLQTNISVMPTILRAGLDYIDNNFISPEAFLLDAIGFSSEELARLRDKYLA